MSAFSPKNVAKAIEKIPQTDSATLRSWAARARERDLHDLLAACERELELRPVDLKEKEAATHAAWAERTRDMSLRRAIEFAFSQLPVRDYELKLIRTVAERPGITYPELVASYGNRDAALVIGHCVYDRFGCFKPWTESTSRMSDILFARDEAGPSVRYKLTEDASAAFANIGIL